jgi:NTE family protein
MASNIGLILSGGGARASYQVGVLGEIAKIRAERQPSLIGEASPFKVVCGTSAGAINGAALATRSDDFDKAVLDLEKIWARMHAGDVYLADSWGVARSGARWLTLFSIGWAFAKWRKSAPRSLLDNQPLWGLLEKAIPWERLPALFANGSLTALAVAASSYTNGQHETFYQCARSVAPWLRSSRVALETTLDNRHLMASAAIPFVFPAVELGDAGWFGDGSMRQTAPISPAVHLGADKVLVVGAGRMAEPPAKKQAGAGYPSLGQIGGHALSNIFLDALASDVERMTRINNTLARMDPAAKAASGLREVDLLLIAPSQRLDQIAAELVGALPLPVRAMLGALGVGKNSGGGGALASYLLFEPAYTGALIELGRKDARAQEARIVEFFGW